MSVKSYKDLIIWQRSMDMVELIYRITEDLPSKENFGLTSQMRRAAVAVPSDIAEIVEISKMISSLISKLH
jgi:hypothetical protein